MLTESQERTALDRNRLDLSSRQQSLERMHWAKTEAADAARNELPADGVRPRSMAAFAWAIGRPFILPEQSSTNTSSSGWRRIS